MRHHPCRGRGKQYFQYSIWLTVGNYSDLFSKQTTKQNGSSFEIIYEHKYYSANKYSFKLTR